MAKCVQTFDWYCILNNKIITGAGVRAHLDIEDLLHGVQDPLRGPQSEGQLMSSALKRQQGEGDRTDRVCLQGGHCALGGPQPVLVHAVPVVQTHAWPGRQRHAELRQR